MKHLPFLLPYSVPALLIAGCLQGESAPFRIVFWMFVVVILLDTFISDRARNCAESRDNAISQDFWWRLAVCIWSPAQAAIVVCGLITLNRQSLDWFEVLSVIVSVGMTGGMLSAPAAHELMHRRSRFERTLGEVLMSLMSYTHFCVEHVQGHHSRVATVEDPATARIGESLYAFYPRAVFGGFSSAWNLEAARLRKQRRPVVNLRNRVVSGMLVQAAIYSGIGYLFGNLGILFFAAQSIVGFSILEAINYVQHYGLSRQKGADGRYEIPTRMHSWNSSHPVSNRLLWNLGRHSDHHCHADKNFRALRGRKDAPQLPTGLFGMCVLALFPPLWFQVMDPLAAAARDPRRSA